MIEVLTTPTPELNVSKVAINLTSAQEFGMQFSLTGFGKFKDSEGADIWGSNPLVSTLLSVTGKSWSDWVPGAAPSDSDYIIDLALKQLVLTRAPAVEAPAVEEPAEEEAAE
jgi:hypothetical protein